MNSYPLYFLQLDGVLRIVFPEDKPDINHSDYWEQTVSYLVAQHYCIPQRKLANLPYCQRRARVVGNKVYMGTHHPDPKLLIVLREVLGEDDLTFAYDYHEKRLREDVRQFKQLIRNRSR